VTASLRIPRRAALVTIAAIIAAASLTSFAESYRGLYDWAREHGLPGLWAAAWPLQLDTFIAVGELALFVALADRWAPRSRAAAWTVTLLGLAASVAGNVGHVRTPLLSDRATAAVPPLAAAAALAVGLGVLKRVVEHNAPGAPTDAPAAGNGAPPWLHQAHEEFAAEMSAGEVPTYRAIRSRLGVGAERAQQVRAHLAALAASDRQSGARPVRAAQPGPVSPGDTAR
jgi:Protein of unknown function (DUF2637)